MPFSFSSNGDGFVFRDATLATGTLETNLGLDEFPSPAELWERYCAWKGWTPEVRDIAEQAYSPSKTPRYYQLNAINRTVEAIAKGQQPRPARHGHRHRQDLHRVPDHLAALEERAAARSASCSWPTATS